jgi:DNA-directed RNA polymerase specialized sigma24 family protein
MPYLNDLYRTAVHLLGSAAGAEDVIQDGLALPHTLHGRQQFAEFQQ